MQMHVRVYITTAFSPAMRLLLLLLPSLLPLVFILLLLLSYQIFPFPVSVDGYFLLCVFFNFLSRVCSFDVASPPASAGLVCDVRGAFMLLVHASHCSLS